VRLTFSSGFIGFLASIATRTTDEGKTLATLSLVCPVRTPPRSLKAAAHYLAVLAELGSGPLEQWNIDVTSDGLCVATVSIATATSAAAEVDRARAVLEDVLVAARLSQETEAPSV
jgi:hypothetical protein